MGAHLPGELDGQFRVGPNGACNSLSLNESSDSLTSENSCVLTFWIQEGTTIFSFTTLCTYQGKKNVVYSGWPQLARVARIAAVITNWLVDGPIFWSYSSVQGVFYHLFWTPWLLNAENVSVILVIQCTGVGTGICWKFRTAPQLNLSRAKRVKDRESISLLISLFSQISCA